MSLEQYLTLGAKRPPNFSGDMRKQGHHRLETTIFTLLARRPFVLKADSEGFVKQLSKRKDVGSTPPPANAVYRMLGTIVCSGAIMNSNALLSRLQPHHCTAQVYKVFQRYERLRPEQHAFDNMDLVHYIYRALKARSYRGVKVHELYRDEVQDITQAELLMDFRCRFRLTCLPLWASGPDMPRHDLESGGCSLARCT